MTVVDKTPRRIIQERRAGRRLAMGEALVLVFIKPSVIVVAGRRPQETRPRHRLTL
jgi:hypothetical protein